MLAKVVGAGDVRILECKTAGIYGAHLERCCSSVRGLQVMHQLAVTGKAAADVAVLLGIQDLQVFRIMRDEAMIAQLITLERRFWDCLKRDQAPATDGSGSADLALRALSPRNNGRTLD